jgi:HD-GYP domain-containing protein (c-di-GMP phosphodiesterase class II)
MAKRVLAGIGLAALFSPMGALALFLAAPSLDPTIMRFDLHFWAVGATALAAGIACALLVASARSLRETRLLFLALAFVTVAGIFSVHGLMTPGYLVGGYHTSVAVSGWFSVAAGAIFVALSVVELPRRAEALVRRGGGVILAWVVVAAGAYVLVSITIHDWLDAVPTDERSIQYVFGAASFVLYAVATHRYYQAYQFARLPSQGAMVISLALLAQVPALLVWGTTWHLSWWLYHALYGASFAVLFAGWAVEVRRTGSLKVIAEALSMRDALAQLNRGSDAHVLELVDAIEAKDVATLGHVRRVSAYALAIGKRMGLPPGELRALALAAEMHDVGKIGVPDAILAKPGPLTDDEFAEMQRHTGRGYDIARRVEALRTLAPVIRAHHERFNGRGYPDGLAGEAIPVLARVIAVADTYDAMTSPRPYRPALSHEAAVAELRRVRGTELDPRCVDAFLASLDEDLRKAA